MNKLKDSIDKINQYRTRVDDRKNIIKQELYGLYALLVGLVIALIVLIIFFFHSLTVIILSVTLLVVVRKTYLQSSEKRRQQKAIEKVFHNFSYETSLLTLLNDFSFELLERIKELFVANNMFYFDEVSYYAFSYQDFKRVVNELRKLIILNQARITLPNPARNKEFFDTSIEILGSFTDNYLPERFPLNVNDVNHLVDFNTDLYKENYTIPNFSIEFMETELKNNLSEEDKLTMNKLKKPLKQLKECGPDISESEKLKILTNGTKIKPFVDQGKLTFKLDLSIMKNNYLAVKIYLRDLEKESSQEKIPSYIHNYLKYMKGIGLHKKDFPSEGFVMVTNCAVISDYNNHFPDALLKELESKD